MKKNKLVTSSSKKPSKNDEYGQFIIIKKIASEKAMEMLRNAGMDVQGDEAEEIMEFLYTLTKITLKDFFSHG